MNDVTRILSAIEQGDPRAAELPPPPIREINPAIPGWLESLIAGLHARDPNRRPQTAEEVAETLGRHLADLQQPARNFVPDEARWARAISKPDILPRGTWHRWLPVAAAIVLRGMGLGAAEATGVTDVRGTVIRLLSPEGTLVVEVDDPEVRVTIDGSDVVITGAGAKEIRMKPGKYTVEASKDGKVVRQEWVTVTRNGRQVVKVSQEAPAEIGTIPKVAANVSEWERSVADLPSSEQVKAVIARLKLLNPGLHDLLYDDFFDVVISSEHLKDVSPLRAMPGLRGLHLNAPNLRDLSPLQGMNLTSLDVFYSGVSDLSPLRGMKLRRLDLSGSARVTDLSPLKGMPLREISIAYTGVSDLTPLEGMELDILNCDSTKVVDISPSRGAPLKHLELHDTRVADLSPIQGMPLESLRFEGSAVTDLSPIRGIPLNILQCDFQAARDAEILRAIPTLEVINSRPAAEFWKNVDAR